MGREGGGYLNDEFFLYVPFQFLTKLLNGTHMGVNLIGVGQWTTRVDITSDNGGFVVLSSIVYASTQTKSAYSSTLFL